MPVRLKHTRIKKPRALRLGVEKSGPQKGDESPLGDTNTEGDQTLTTPTAPGNTLNLLDASPDSMESRPLQNLDVLALALEISGQHRSRFAHIIALHLPVHLDNSAELREPLGRAFLHQKVGVVLNAHGVGAYVAGTFPSVTIRTKYSPLTSLPGFQVRS